jgi:hypothetical protein
MTGGDGRIWPLSARDLVAVQQRLGPATPDTTAAMSARTLWHTIYDQHALTAHTSFYPGETAAQDDARAERRSPYLHLTLSTA